MSTPPAPPPDTRLLLKAHEVAERLSVARSTVYEMMASGALPSIRIGRSVRVPVSALNEWLQQQIDNRGQK